MRTHFKFSAVVVLTISLLGCEQIATESADGTAKSKTGSKSTAISQTYAGDSIEAIYIDLQTDEDISAEQAESIAEDLAYEISPDQKIWDKTYAKTAALGLVQASDAASIDLNNKEFVEGEIAGGLTVVAAKENFPAAAAAGLIKAATAVAKNIDFAEKLAAKIEKLESSDHEKIANMVSAASGMVAKLDDSGFKSLIALMPPKNQAKLIAELTEAADDSKSEAVSKKMSKFVEVAANYKSGAIASDVVNKLMEKGAGFAAAAVAVVMDKVPAKYSETVAGDIAKHMEKPEGQAMLGGHVKGDVAAKMIAALPASHASRDGLKAEFEKLDSGFAAKVATQSQAIAKAIAPAASSTPAAGTGAVVASPTPTPASSATPTGGGSDSMSL
jgi:hypothetical protein